MRSKTTTVFSLPLFKQTCKSNVILAVAILLVMCMMANVTNYAASIMSENAMPGMMDFSVFFNKI